jgi:hypothetical protein
MEPDNFEEELKNMTKPEVTQLKHQEILQEEILRNKDKSALNWWWLSIPVYAIAVLVMKTAFMPNTTLLSNIHELGEKNELTTILMFVVLPVVLILVNLLVIRKIYCVSGSPKTTGFLKVVWFNILVIVCSLLILIIYSL